MKSFGSRFGGIWPRKKAIMALTILCMFSVVSGFCIKAKNILRHCPKISSTFDFLFLRFRVTRKAKSR